MNVHDFKEFRTALLANGLHLALDFTQAGAEIAAQLDRKDSYQANPYRQKWGSNWNTLYKKTPTLKSDFEHAQNRYARVQASLKQDGKFLITPWHIKTGTNLPENFPEFLAMAMRITANNTKYRPSQANYWKNIRDVLERNSDQFVFDNHLTVMAAYEEFLSSTHDLHGKATQNNIAASKIKVSGASAAQFAAQANINGGRVRDRNHRLGGQFVVKPNNPEND